jgi:hypothetical protein
MTIVFIGFNNWLELKPIPALGWVKILICCVIQVIVSEIGKVFGRKYRDSKK